MISNDKLVKAKETIAKLIDLATDPDVIELCSICKHRDDSSTCDTCAVAHLIPKFATDWELMKSPQHKED